MRSRQAVIEKARSWVGLNESDGSFKQLIDIYNSHTPLARGVKMQYNWEWCATFVSAIAIALGYTDIMPVEIGCGEMINLAMQKGIWQENDGYVPSPADYIMYDWNDKVNGDNHGWPDHVGVIEDVNVSTGYMTVIEGNKNQAVGRRSVLINGRYIRGFITPKYDSNNVEPPKPSTGLSLAAIAKEVIVGKWGSGEARIKALTNAGYNASAIQNEVNRLLNNNMPSASSIPNQSRALTKIVAAATAKSKNVNYARSYITTANLYCRDDAGTNKKALCKIPAGTKVNCYGYYTLFNGTTWLYIQAVVNGVEYTGFSSKDYLR